MARGMWPTAWAASQWNSTPRWRQRAPMLARGCSTPISLFAAITDSSRVSGPRASARRSGASRPSPPTGSTVSGKPWRSSQVRGSSTARCSVARVTSRRRGSPRSRAASATPRRARLLASVAPLVKITASPATPSDSPTRLRAMSTAAPASRAGRYRRLEGLAAFCVHQGAMAASTAGSHGVLAWWSR